MVQNGPPPVAHVASAPVPRNESFLSSELCHLAGLTAEQLAELESYGLLTGKGSGAATTYTIDDLAIAQAAAGFMQHGVEGRHLRAWRQAAEREASLFEQMILPLLRQRNPQARQQAVTTLEALSVARWRASFGDRPIGAEPLPRRVISQPTGVGRHRQGTLRP